MEKVTIWGKDDIGKIVEKLPDEMRNNPVFLQEFIYPIENTLYWDKKQVEVIISDDAKYLQVFPKADIDRDPKDPKGHSVSTEYKMDENDNLEIIRSEGYLHDADTYYSKRGEKKPDHQITSILDTYYTRKLIDKDGIEMAHGTFYKSDWPLTSVRYDDIGSLNTQLLSNGKHKPAKWYADGVETPLFGYNSHVSGVSRSNDNPAFANTYGYDLTGPNKERTNFDSYIAVVHSEWPHTLRVDEYEKLAKFNNGQLELCGNHPDFEGYSLGEIFKDVSLKYEAALDASKTREIQGNMYDVLKERLENANLKYKEPDLDHGRQM